MTDLLYYASIVLIICGPSTVILYLRHQPPQTTRARALERSIEIVPTRMLNIMMRDHMRKWDREFWASLGGGTLPPYGPHRHELTPDPRNGDGIPSNLWSLHYLPSKDQLETHEIRAESLRKPSDPDPFLSKRQLIDDNTAAAMLILARDEFAKSRKAKPEDC